MVFTPDDGVVIFSSKEMLNVDTCSLVLSSKNIAHRIDREPDGSASILVAPDLEEMATGQLKRYFQENRNWPPKTETAEIEPLATAPPTILAIGAMALFYMVTGPFQTSSPWFANGAGNSREILYGGEYYRLVTALTLHADFSHLAGNCLIGGFLLHFFLQINGTGLGLLLLLLSAATGNYLNVLIHGPGHIFVGFSTAVFAMIGMLSMHQIIEQRRPFGIKMIVPFMAGAALLAMLGSSGVRTDLGAHLFGLLSGVGFGVISGIGQIQKIRKSSFVQTCAFLVSLFTLLTCWNLALAI